MAEGYGRMEAWGPRQQGSAVSNVKIRSGGTWGAFAEGFKLGWGAMDDTIKAIRDRKKQKEAKEFNTTLSEKVKNRQQNDNVNMDLSKKTWGAYTTQSRYESEQRKQQQWNQTYGVAVADELQHQPWDVSRAQPEAQPQAQREMTSEEMN